MLIINEIANNHQGSIEIGKKIVDGLVPLKKRYPEFDFAIKLQLRNLETFIHPDYKTRFDLPHIQRFMETKLSDIKILELCNYIKERGFKLGITAFDENALEFIETFCSPDFLKIASCCANEWSLINKICETDRYIIASTGGLNWDETDNLYHFLKHKKKDFSLMHCVGIYPAPMEEMDLNIIEKMKKRYECLIGFSDHSFKQSFEAGLLMKYTKNQ